MIVPKFGFNSRQTRRAAMVEIIPYIEDENDKTSWIPLSSSSSSAAGETPSTSASSASSAGRRRRSNSESPLNEDTMVFVEHTDNDEDSDDWQELSASPLLQQQQQQPPTLPATMARMGIGGIEKLISLATAVTSAPPPVERNVGDDDIIWQRANRIEDNDTRAELYRAVIGSGGGENNARKGGVIKPSYFSTAEEIDPFVPLTGQQHERNDRKRPPPPSPNDYQSSSSSTLSSASNVDVESTLRRKLIHDPLRSLPYHFVRNLYYEIVYQLKSQQNYNVMIPIISLILLIASFGLAFIGMGLSGLLRIFLRAVVRTCTSFTVWLVGHMIAMAFNKWIWTIIVLIGSSTWILWTRNTKRKIGEEENVDTTLTTRVSTISVILPWIVAITSPSNIEALIIILSLMSFLSGLFPCHAGASTLFVVIVALLVTVMNIYVISTAANKLEEYEHEKRSSKYHDDEGKIPVVGDLSPVDDLDEKNTVIPSPVCGESCVNRKRILIMYTHIQQHICECHVISIATLATMSTFLILVQALYSYFRNEGMNFIFTFGKVSCHVLYMGIGFLILHELWNSTIFVVTGNHISWGEVTRIALKKSIIEVSSNTVWSKEDVGSGLLGIFSDDDGALRYAILEWVIDRWTTSPKPTKQTTTSQPVADPTSFTLGGGGKDNATSSSSNTKTNSSTASRLTSIPTYQSLYKVLNKLDADESLIPTIDRYRDWVYSLPPTEYAAMCVSLWKMCPATTTCAVAVVWCIGYSAVDLIAGVTNGNGRNMMCFIITVLFPSMLLEYHRVQTWWTRTQSLIVAMESEVNTGESQMIQRDFTMILLTADNEDSASQRVLNAKFPLDTSSLLLRIWHLLIESITMLESFIPAARCATVAVAATDLTSNTMTLVNFALEIKQRGLLFGVGMIVLDAFGYHLSKELEKRTKEADDNTDRTCEEIYTAILPGQFTSAAVDAVSNVGKVSHNLSCLMVKRNSEQGGLKSDIEVEIEKEEVSNSSSTEPPSKDDSHADCKQSEIDKNQDNFSLKQETSLQEEEQCKEDGKVEQKDDNGGIQLLIGGGIALFGAVAGLAVHAAASKGRHKKKDISTDS